MTMRITITDTAVFTVNKELAVLIIRDSARSVNRFFLRIKHVRSFGVSFTFDLPTSVMRCYMLVFAQNFHLLPILYIVAFVAYYTIYHKPRRASNGQNARNTAINHRRKKTTGYYIPQVCGNDRNRCQAACCLEKWRIGHKSQFGR